MQGMSTITTTTRTHTPKQGTDGDQLAPNEAAHTTEKPPKQPSQ